MFQHLKNLLLYDGLSSKEEYKSIVPDIRARYRIISMVASVVLSVAFALLFVMSFSLENLKTNRVIYLICAIVSLSMIIVPLFSIRRTWRLI